MREKFREKRLRQKSRAHELLLIRSWTLNPKAPHYRTYALVDRVRGTLVLADRDTGYGMSLDDIEHFLEAISANSLVRGVSL